MKEAIIIACVVASICCFFLVGVAVGTARTKAQYNCQEITLPPK